MFDSHLFDRGFGSMVKSCVSKMEYRTSRVIATLGAIVCGLYREGWPAAQEKLCVDNCATDLEGSASDAKCGVL